jgi:hypothetical protein
MVVATCVGSCEGDDGDGGEFDDGAMKDYGCGK